MRPGRSPRLDAEPARLADVAGMREAYRAAMGCQIVHDSWHARGFTDIYLLRVDGAVAGYGAIGGPPDEPRELLKEFFLQPAYLSLATPLCRALIAAGAAGFIEAQSNDPLLTALLEALTTDRRAETLLFADGEADALQAPDVVLRPIAATEHDRIFAHSVTPIGTHGLERAGTIVATGGFLLHYNRPFADIYMAVAESERRKGYGSFLVQQLMILARDAGHVPAARCRRENVGSQRALLRAGFRPCGHIARGRILATE